MRVGVSCACGSTVLDNTTLHADIDPPHPLVPSLPLLHFSCFVFLCSSSVCNILPLMLLLTVPAYSTSVFIVLSVLYPLHLTVMLTHLPQLLRQQNYASEQ